MRNVMIVNTDPEFVSILSEMIDWDMYNCQISGSCNDGTQAMEVIMRQKPDIVFIQLNLPGLSGLDIISKVSHHGILTEFIITEEHGDFKSAKEAMKYGVREFLEYPITEEDLDRILDKKSEDLTSTNTKEVENYLWVTRRLLRNSFMRNFVIAEDHQRYSIDALNKYYHFSFKEGIFQVVLVQLRNLVKSEENSFLPAVVEELRARFDPVCNEMIPFIHGASRLTLLFNYDEGSEVPDKLVEIESVILEFLNSRNCTYTSYSIGIGDTSTDVNNLIYLLHSAERASYCSILKGSDRIYWFKKLTFDNVTAEDALTPDVLSELEIGIESMDYSRYDAALHKAFKKITPQTDPEVMVNICLHSITEVAKASEDSDSVKRDDILRILYKIMNVSSVSVMISALVENARLRLETAKKEREFTRPVREATKFIKKNYAKNITLEDVADYVHLNASYLSMLFKKETGTNYIGFLTECRIDEAKRLLKDSGLSVAEICYAVGYSDKKHFSRLFIKRVGIRPTTYRSLH